MEWENIEITDKELEKQTEMYKKLAMDAAARSLSKTDSEPVSVTEINAGSDINNILGNDVNISDLNFNIENISVFVPPEENEAEDETDDAEYPAQEEYEEDDDDEEIETVSEDTDDAEKDYASEEIPDHESEEAVFAYTENKDETKSTVSDDADSLDEYIKKYNSEEDNFRDE